MAVYLFFVEDKRHVTTDAWRDNGINVAKGLEGITEVARYLNILKETENVLVRNVYFIIDNDKAYADLTRYMDVSINEKDGFRKYLVGEKLYLVVLPDQYAVEDLYDEFDNFLEECISKLVVFKKNKAVLAESIPTNLSRTCDILRKNLPNNKGDIRKLVRNAQDIKDLFWKKVKKEDLKMSRDKITSLQSLFS